MLRAMEMGQQPAKVLEQLKKISTKPVPDNVRRSFTDWQAKGGRIRIRNVTILETDSRELLAEIESIAANKQLVKKNLKWAAELMPSSESALKAATEKRGWFVELQGIQKK